MEGFDADQNTVNTVVQIKKIEMKNDEIIFMVPLLDKPSIH